MTSNKWLGKLKSGFNTAREITATKIGQAAKTLDENLKGVETHLTKKQAEMQAEIAATEKANTQQTTWRRSEDNPNGELVHTQAPKPIIVVPQTTIVEIISSALSTSHEPSKDKTPEPETHVIPHSKARKHRSRHLTQSISHESSHDSGSDQRTTMRRHVSRCLNQIIDQIVLQEEVQKSVEQMLDVISIVDDLVEETSIISPLIISAPESGLDSTLELTVESMCEIKDESESESESEMKEEATQNLESESEPELKEEAKDDSESELQLESTLKQTLKLELASELESESQLQSDAGAKVESETESELEPEPEPQIEREVDLDLVEKEQEVSIVQEREEIENKQEQTLHLTDSEDEDEASLKKYFETLTTSQVNETPIPIEKTRSISSSSISSSEDIFQEITIPRRCAPPPVEAPNELKALRDLISTIGDDKSESNDEEEEEDDDDDDDDDDNSNEKQPETSEILSLLSTPIFEEIPVSVENSPSIDLSSILNSQTEEDDKVFLEESNGTASDSSSLEWKEDLPPPSSSSSSASPSSPVPSTSSFVLEANGSCAIEQKPLSGVYGHLIPPQTNIIYMSCSSEYLYICTSEHRIFYAKIHLDSIDLPLKWQQHSDLAERLDVNPSNKVVWRWYDQHLYMSIDPLESPPLGSEWDDLKLGYRRTCLSCCVNDHCGWLIKDDGSLWLVKIDQDSRTVLHVMCPFQLKRVVGFTENIAVSTNDGEVLIRFGCTADRLEGDGWIFVQHNLGPLDDFLILCRQEMFVIVDREHRLCIRSWSSQENFFEVLCNDDVPQYSRSHLICANSHILFFADCQEQIHLFLGSISGIEWKTVQKNTRLQRLVGAFSDQEHVWALNTDKMICSSDGQVLEKPRQAHLLTHASFVPNVNCEGTILWTLDESCNIYVRSDATIDSHWEQLDQIQFEWSRRLIHMVCNNAGVWAVDDHGHIYFRHGHAGTRRSYDLDDLTTLSAAWISIPGAPKKNRSFTQIFCGPADWMVYATDNKQAVYARCEITHDNRVGTSWKPIDDCYALELAISEHSLWLLTSFGKIQCRENISLENPIGTRSTTLPGTFLSLTVSADDKQVWALDSNRNLLKLDRLTILLEK